jgi:predicted nuclease of predicted toxin-antitoxin system
MTIYVDENVPLKITQRLRAEGYKVEYVMRRLGDKEILEAAYQQNALLITSDKDFERMVMHEHRLTAGVILLRISTRIPIESRAQIVANALRRYKDNLQGTFTIITEGAVEIRHPLV